MNLQKSNGDIGDGVDETNDPCIPLTDRISRAVGWIVRNTKLDRKRKICSI